MGDLVHIAQMIPDLLIHCLGYILIADQSSFSGEVTEAGEDEKEVMEHDGDEGSTGKHYTRNLWEVDLYNAVIAVICQVEKNNYTLTRW